jgi:hypothetical protein
MVEGKGEAEGEGNGGFEIFVKKKFYDLYLK